MNTLSKTQVNVWLVSFVLAPLLLTAAHSFGNEYALNNTSGWLGVLAFTVWILAFQGMFNLVQSERPRYAAIGFILAVYGSVAGTNFMVDGLYLDALNLTTIESKNELHGKFGFGGLVAFYIPGLLFPLSLVALGITYLQLRTVNPWVAALLIIAGICFPLGRIPRIATLIHLDNALLVVSHLLLALEAKRHWLASGTPANKPLEFKMAKP